MKLFWAGVRDTVGMQASVDRIFYSPDSLKLFAFIVDRERPRSGRVTYSGEAVAGFRPRTDTLWTLYRFGQLSPVGASSPEEITELLHQYYLGERFSKASAWIFQNGEPVLQEYEYGPGDPQFWTESLVWRKGALAPGRYFFEFRRTPTAGDVTQVEMKEPLPTPYPDTLIKQFTH